MLYFATTTACLAILLTIALIVHQHSSSSPCFVASHGLNHLVSINNSGHNINKIIGCPHHQRAALLQLKHGFSIRRFDGSNSDWNKLDSWINADDIDCCSWDGITCDASTGHVIGLNLNSYPHTYVVGQIHSSLFTGALGTLQSLDLSYNDFRNQPIPSGFGQLSNLTHLDLSWCRFIGHVPSELSNLKRLVYLNLSWNQRLGSQPIPSWMGHLSNLTHLDLSWCGFTRQVPSELSNLKRLVFFSLADNYQLDAQPIPSWLGHFSNLTHLDLSSGRFVGQVPIEFSKLTNLISLDLSSNDRLELKNPNLATLFQNLSTLTQLYLDGIDVSAAGHQWQSALSSTSVLPNLKVLSLRNCSHSGPIPPTLFQRQSLSELDLSENNMASQVPKFLGNLTSLRSLSLSDCRLYGEFPKTLFSNLTSLIALDISYNPNLTIVLTNQFAQTTALQILRLDSTNFPVDHLPPSFTNLTSLKELSLHNCNLSGSISSFLPINNLNQIQYLDLSSNRFTGEIPSSLFSHPSLLQLSLSNNQLSGWLGESSNVSSSLLNSIDLSNNKLHGPLPKSIFQCKYVEELTLSYNNFSHTIELGMFLNLPNLKSLGLSNSGLSIIKGNGTSSFKAFAHQIGYLNLQACNISEFPLLLKNQSQLQYLDLSNNKITGEIPNWIWKVGNGSLSYLNISHNLLEGFEYPLPDFYLNQLYSIDLHSNKLQGSLPSFPISIGFQDFSNNSFTSAIPNTANFTSTWFISLSSNNFSGEIPLSICDSQFLQVLDLSHNNFNGNIPKCLVEKVSNSLQVLNLRKNSFRGPLPQAFKDGCNLQTLNLYGNKLEGRLPSSIEKCKYLEVLDVGDNRFKDTFPFWVERMPSLHVLILKSNNFFGQILHSQTDYPSFPSLQIIDLSSNFFTGNLSTQFFSRFKAMIGDHGLMLNSNGESIKYSMQDGRYYQDTVTVTIKDLNLEFVKIFSALNVIDLSNNCFQGEIPKSIGDLVLLYALNFSRNDFTGEIPFSVANLVKIESLDLSKNKFSGNIPWQLTELTFLAVLDLSDNLLIGEIPQTHQFSTFGNKSFLGNTGLCGPPLATKCEDMKNIPSNFGMNEEKDNDQEMMWIGFGIGYGVGLGGFLWTLVLWKSRSRKYMQCLDRASQWIICWSQILFYNCYDSLLYLLGYK